MTAAAASAAPPDSSPLDREAPLPLYFQLREALLGEIRDAGLQPGDRLPTESDIERRYRVSRSTIRQALAEMAAEGLIHRVQGLGTFVAAPKIRHIPLLTSFSELVTSQGFAPSHRVLASSIAGAPRTVAAELGLDSDAPCRFLRRLLLADDRVVGLAETWLPHDSVAAHDALFEPERLAQGSLYELLQRPPVGLVLQRATETISPGAAEPADAELLGCAVGTPVLVIRRVTFTPEDRAVEFTRLLFVGDRYEYRVELHRPPTVGPGA